MRQRIQAFSLTDTGRKRKENQDFCAVFSKGDALLMVVADGVGGHKCGDVASRLAVETLRRMFNETEIEDPRDFFEHAIQKANQEVRNYIEATPSCKGMATTFTAVIIRNSTLTLLHVGDSRAYLLRKGRFQRLTEDHTLVRRMMQEGVLSPEEAKTHPKRHIIVNAVGIAPIQEFDLRQMELQVGDKILLCSDGLYDEVSEREIAKILEENSPKEAVRKLVETANEAGGKDNISVTLAVMEGSALMNTKHFETSVASTPLASRRLKKVFFILILLVLGCGGIGYWSRTTDTGRRLKARVLSFFRKGSVFCEKAIHLNKGQSEKGKGFHDN